MSIRILSGALALTILAACSPAVPDSAAGVADSGVGVGFDNSIEANRQRAEAARTQMLQRPAPVTALPISSETTPAAAGGTPARDPQLLTAEAAADARARAANSGEAVVNASPSNPAPQILENPGISKENNFDVVSSARSIESDAARLAANRAQYTVVSPTALPDRDDRQGPNIVAYALQTQHAPGTRVHRRAGLGGSGKYARACAGFGSDDQAQIAFLEKGGPKRDRLGVDPDGDGFACNWDPRPFRRAAAGG